jgi:hypothetical protein
MVLVQIWAKITTSILDQRKNVFGDFQSKEKYKSITMLFYLVLNIVLLYVFMLALGILLRTANKLEYAICTRVKDDTTMS